MEVLDDSLWNFGSFYLLCPHCIQGFQKLKLNCAFLRNYVHKMVQNFTGNFKWRPSRGLSYQESKMSRVKSKKTKWSTTPFLVKFLRIGFGNQTWTWANLNCDPRCQLLILLLRGPRLSADEFHLLNWGCIVIRENLQGNLTYIIQF